MRAGKLNKRLWLQDPPTVRDAVTHEVSQRDEDWTPVAQVWASVNPIDGLERYAAAKVEYEATHVVGLRYRVVNTTQRFLLDARKLNIVSVVDVNERHRELIVLCKEVT